MTTGKVSDPLRHPGRWIAICVCLLFLSLPGSVSPGLEQSPQTGLFRAPLPFVTFLEKTLLKVPATRSIEVGDLNGDGSADIVFVTSDPGVIWVSTGDGSGNFGLPQKLGFGSSYADIILGQSFIVGDFDYDGRDEFLHFQTRRITSDSAEATLFLASSNVIEGNSIRQRLAVPLFGKLAHATDRLFLCGSDVDRDGRSDFIFGDKNFRDIFFIRNTPELWTSSPSHLSEQILRRIHVKPEAPGFESGPLQVLMLDADNDGFADIVNIGEKNIVMIHGGANGFVAASANGITPNVLFEDQRGLFFGPGARALYGRLNRDAFPDLLLFDGTGASRILLNQEGRGFSLFVPVDLSAAPFVEMGDFNGDGMDDLVAWGGAHRGITILLNNGLGRFTRAIEKTIGSGTVSSMAVHDINGDGLSDIVVTLSGSSWGLEGRVLLNVSQRLMN